MNTSLIKQHILSGEIKVWADVYRYTTAKEMEEAFGREYRHWEYVRRDPLAMSLRDVFKIMEVLKITKKQFDGLFENNVGNN